MSDSFKLLSFNVYDDERRQDDDDGNNNGFVPCKDREFMVQMFGINEDGETASIFVEGFTPFFYVLVDKVGVNEKDKDLSQKCIQQ